MFDYLKQFKSLPKELKEKISSEVAMKTLSELEEKYKVTLASTVMKVMVKKISINNLASHLVSEFSMNPENAKKLSQELKEKLFFSVSGYLGLKPSFDQEKKQAKKIIEKSGINFSSSDLYNRCLKVITTFLRGVRSRIDTRSVLEKPLDSGGLGLDQQKSDHLIRTSLNFIANLKEETPQKEEKKPIEPSPLAGSDAVSKILNKEKTEQEKGFDLKKEIETGRTPSITAPEKTKKIEGTKEEFKKISLTQKDKEDRKKEEEKEEKEEKKEDIMSFAPPPKKEKKESQEEEKKEDIMSFAPPPKKGIKQIFKVPKKEKAEEEKKEEKKEEKVEEKKEEKKKEVKKEEKKDKKESEEKTWSSKPRPVSDSGSKRKIEDIKTAPKVMGPIDELRYLSLVNFRRLGEEPEEATLKIRKKINLLEKDGYDKKIQAVLAWKKSPVNRLYISLGQEAVKQGESLEKLAEQKQEKNKESLSWEEVKAIMQLNTQLSYF